MEILPNAFSLRGESGLVKIVSDSVFDPSRNGSLYVDDAQCDIIVESNGFRVNKTIVLNMPQVARFLRELGEAVARGDGEAALRNEGDELALSFTNANGKHTVFCAMNDKREGKENSVQVKYPIEASYYEDLRSELVGARILSR
jgi:hypothetical protein